MKQAILFVALVSALLLAAISDGRRLIPLARAQVLGDDASSGDAASADASPPVPVTTCGFQAFVGDGLTSVWGPVIPFQPDISFVLVANVMAASGTLGGAGISSRTVTIRKGDHGGGTHFHVTIEPAVPPGGGFEVDWCVVR